MKFTALLVCALGAITLLSAEPTVRDWTNTEGRTLSAVLVELSGDTATLRMSNGRQYQVSLATLSEADREFAAQWERERAAAARFEKSNLKIGLPREVIVESAFDGEAPRTRKGELAGWQAGIGEWRIEDGALIGDELAEDNHASSFTYRIAADQLIILAQVQLGTAEQIAFAIRDDVSPNLHLARLYITPEQLWIQHMSGISKTTKSEKLISKEVGMKPGEWYDVTIEIIGDRYRAVVGDEVIEATHPRFGDGKGIVALVNRGQGARFRNVSLWHASPQE